MQHTVTITIPEALEPRVHVLDDFDTFISVITINALQNLEKHDLKKRLANAAELMLQDYTTNSELTGFTSLDGEPFYE